MKALHSFFILLCICESLCRMHWCHIPQSCPTEFRPVCGKKGDDMRTFPNHCQFLKSNCLEGWDFLRDGDCYAGQKIPLEIVSIEKMKKRK